MRIIVPGIFFLSLFYFLTPPIFDPDFWWHLATGRWIWENGAIPSQDPFGSVSIPGESNIRSLFILRQYWLAQVLGYGIYSLGGFAGVVVFRALLFTGMFYVLYRLLRRVGAGELMSTLLTALSAYIIVIELTYIGDRPQMYTSFFVPLVILMLEALGKEEKWAVWGLPPIMLLWANMHGGFILGDVFIAVYLVTGLLGRTVGRTFIIVSLAAMALSLLNPNGATAFPLTFSVFAKAEGSRYSAEIVEFQSIFSHGSVAGVLRRLQGLALMGGISVLSFVLAAPLVKRMKIVHVVLFIAGLLMFYRSIRFLIFFVMLASMCTAINYRLILDGLSRRFADKTATETFIRWSRRATLALTVIATLWFSWFFVSTAMQGSSLPSGPYFRSSTMHAVEFMRENGLKGRIFTELDAGGELIWWHYMGLQPFMDGRSLSLKGFEQFSLAMDKPLTRRGVYGQKYLYQEVLEDNNIDLVLIPGADKVSGTTIALSMVLLQSSEWSVVYADSRMILYMRRTPETRVFIEKHGKPDTYAYQNMLALGTHAIRSRHAVMMPGLPLTMALAHKGLGNREKALYWIDRYLSMLPRNPYGERLQSEIMRMP